MGCIFSQCQKAKAIFDSEAVVSNLSEITANGTLQQFNPILSDCAILSRAGFYKRRKVNQDRSLLHFDSKNNILVFGVFDGHGIHGHIVAECIRSVFLELLLVSEYYPSYPINAITYALDKAEDRMIEEKGQFCRDSGTTALIGLIKENILYTVNVGDSRSFLQYVDEQTGKICYCPVSTIHAPDIESESLRIRSHGGYIRSYHPLACDFSNARVYSDADCRIGGLAMSRSIGDIDLRRCGVISDPDIYETDLKKKQVHAILFGSDGLTTYYGPDRCFARLQSKGTAEEGLERLICDCYKDSYESSRRSYVDDMSGIYIELSH